jgi:hypothetical protein
MNYGQLQSHFQDLLNRSDITQALTEQFIQQGIARIERTLRTPMQEKMFNINITTQTTQMTLPSDFLQIISLYYDQYELERVSMRRFRELNFNNYQGKPQYFVRQAANLLLYPQPTTGTLTLYYYAEFPPLVNAADTTALTQVASDLIIYSALTFAADFYLDERAALFEDKYQRFFTELQDQAHTQEIQGGTQVILPAYHYADY